MREPGAARSARAAGRFAQQRTVKTMEPKIGSQELHQHLKTHVRADIDGWSIIPDGAEIWLTNPYGLDVGFYVNDAEGCARILKRISSDDHEREWGTL
jgi:hypothetical protein